MSTRPDSDLQGYGNRVGSNYMPRPHLPADARLPLRHLSGVAVPDIEKEPLRMLALALVHLRNQANRLAKMIEDRSRPVDEYTPQTLAVETETQLIIQPAYDLGECITSIVIVGPTGAVTLQLGDRVWNLTIPATGVIVIAPISLRITRQDQRILTAATPGNYNVELMGFADDRSG